MNKSFNHNHYSFQDIERYLQGKMSPAEMHALEKAALQDPFLAEAIEGYEDADLSTVESDLKEIRTLLVEENEEAKIIPLPPARSWWKIAAMIILVAGAGTIGWKILSEQPGNKNATLPSTITAKTKDGILKEKNDTTASVVLADNNAAKKNIALKAQRKPVAASKNHTATYSNTGSETALLSPLAAIASESKQAGRSMDSLLYTTKDRDLTALNQLQDRVTTSDMLNAKERKKNPSNPVGYSVGSVASNNQAVNKIMRGRDSSSAYKTKSQMLPEGADRIVLSEKASGLTPAQIANTANIAYSSGNNFAGSIVQSDVITLGGNLTVTGNISAGSLSYTKPAITNYTVNGNLTSTGNLTSRSIALSPLVNNNNSLDEVVIAGYGTPLKKIAIGAAAKNTNPALQNASIDSRVKFDTTEYAPDSKSRFFTDPTRTQLVKPEGGWPNFDNTLRNKIRVFKKRAGPAFGDIEVKIQLDKTGKLIKATILKSFDNTLNDLIVDFLKQQTHWERPYEISSQEQEISFTIRL